MDETLKHCPFCGGTASIHTENEYSSDTILLCVSCDECTANTLGKTEAEAIEYWNSRIKGD